MSPKCPAYLDERAKQEWRRLVPILKRMKVLTEADGLMLGNLCVTVSTLVKAQEKLNQLGILYKSPSGYVMQSPLLSVVNQCVETITKLSREFGLSPASRTRLTIEKPDDNGDDELMALLSMPYVRKSPMKIDEPSSH
jgi:P27 family predicted phage terminase small subunit